MPECDVQATSANPAGRRLRQGACLVVSRRCPFSKTQTGGTGKNPHADRFAGTMYPGVEGRLALETKPDWTGDACAANAAIAFRVFVEILLMIVFREIERACILDFRGDDIIAF